MAPVVGSGRGGLMRAFVDQGKYFDRLVPIRPASGMSAVRTPALGSRSSPISSTFTGADFDATTRLLAEAGRPAAAAREREERRRRAR